MAESVGNVPAALSSFVGRASELNEVERLVGPSRLVTLTGAGGCGKSRLALEAATRMAMRFPDGAWWVDLTSLSDPLLVPTLVTGSLSIREAADQDLTETLCDRLADDARLLVFDNCEHLSEAVAALIELILRRCSSVAVLATSRARVGIEGEAAFLVPPLSMPGADEEMAAQSESVQLFVARAADAGVSVAVSPAVAAICRELDGMPLALELAAARMRMLTPEQILDGLADRFRLLFGSKRRGAPRHRTLRASVDWSYALLSRDEQVLFRRLAVFPLDFSFESVVAICGDAPLDADRVVETLAGLVDQSLVSVERGGDQVRYRLLETIRAYARGLLAASDEAAEISVRHLDVFLRLAEEAAPSLHGRDQLDLLERLDRERSDLRAALAWARASRAIDAEARLVAALAYFHIYRGALAELSMQVSPLMPPTGEIDPLARAELLLLGSGGMLFMPSDTPRFRALAEAALAIATDEGDAALTGRAYFQLGLGELLSADGRASAAWFEAAIAASRSVGDDMHLGLALTDLGLALHMIGEPARSAALLDDGLDVSQRSGNRWAQANALLWRAKFRSDTGDIDGAREDLLESIARCGELGDLFFPGFQRPLLAQVLIAHGDVDGARREVTAGLAIAQEIRSAFGHAWGMRHLGIVELASGNVERAAAELERAAELSTAAGVPFLTAEALSLLGVAELRRDRPEQAAATFDAAEHAARDRWIVPWTATLLGRAELARRTGDIGRAHTVAHEALETAIRSGLTPLAVESLGLLALTTPFGRAAEAIYLHSGARALRARTGALWSMALGTAQVDYVPSSAELSEADLVSAEERGRCATLEEAVAFAQRGRGQRGRPTFGWDSLSPVQLEVVRLVAAGLTNRQIGEELFISPRTVQSHLRDVFPRVGVSTRGELAAEAARRGL